MTSIKGIVSVALALAFVLVSVAHARVRCADPQAECENAKLKAAGKREFCVAKEAGKAQLGKPTDVAGCEIEFSDALKKADDKAGKKGTSCRYVDNGDGTVSDLDTRLMWQKSDDAGGLTDKDNTYAWTLGDDEPDGAAFSEFLGGLNNCESADGDAVSGGYGGHCDWRMPQIDELGTIVDCSFGNPCIDQSVFGPTAASSFYWSSATFATSPGDAWVVFFNVGFVSTDGKTFDRHVRAVRGGL